MFRVEITRDKQSYHDDKRVFFCPSCKKRHFFITYQDKKCSECGRELPDVAILTGENTRQARRFFKELEKCGK